MFLIQNIATKVFKDPYAYLVLRLYAIAFFVGTIILVFPLLTHIFVFAGHCHIVSYSTNDRLMLPYHFCTLMVTGNGKIGLSFDWPLKERYWFID